MSNALVVAQIATGDIKKYQIVVGGILLLNLPVSYVLLKHGMIPEITVIVAIVISQICMIARLWFLRSMIQLSARQFLKRVYFNVLKVTFIAVIPPAVCYFLIPQPIIRFFVICFVSGTTSIFTIYYIGCNSIERLLIRTYIRKVKTKIMHR